MKLQTDSFAHSSPPGELEAICNYLELSDSVATAGQPTAEQFDAIKAAGFDLVINLAMPNSTNALPNEREIVESHGMRSIQLPVMWDAPHIEDAQRFFDVMDANQNKRVFVHCALNMRVSAFMYLHRTLNLGTSHEAAQQDLNRLWQPN